MKSIFKSSPVNVNYDVEDTYIERIHVFEFEDEEESQDFGVLSNAEQLKELGFKEESTPIKGNADLHRYVIDASDVFIVVRETIISI